MKHFFGIARFGNFDCNRTTLAKDLLNFTSSLHIFVLTPDIPGIRANRYRNKELIMNIEIRKIFTTGGIFLSQQGFRVLSVGKFYDFSFIRNPTVSGDWKTLTTLDIFWLKPELWQMPITTFSK